MVFTWVWVTARILKFTGLFPVFWPSTIMLSFEWSALVRQLPTYNYYLLLESISPQFFLRVFHKSLSDSKSPQVFKALHSIPTLLNIAVSTGPLTSKSYSLFNNPLVNVPKAPITIGIIVTFMFHRFFLFPSKVQVLILLFTIFQLYFVIRRDCKVDNFVLSLLSLLLLLFIY